jgi:hypothetical protein
VSDIFLSYAKEDRGRARILAEAIERAGRSVFWDRKVPAGLTWRRFIGEELRGARCVVVAWTAASVESEWVQEEAEAAKKSGILIPVFLEEVEAPFGFASVHGPDLSAWDGSLEAPDFRQLLADLDRLLGPAGKPASGVSTVRAPVAEERSEPLVAAERPVPEKALASAEGSGPSAGRSARAGLLSGAAGAIFGALLGGASGDGGAVGAYALAWGLAAGITGMLSAGRRVLRYGIIALVLVTVAAMASVGPMTRAFGLLCPIALALGTMIGRGLRSGSRRG